jgi:hypothetical protein
VAKSTPMARASPGSDPSPTVSSRIRPWDRTSMVAKRLARTTGWWYGSSSTPVPSRIRRVAEATKARQSSGSANGSDGGSSKGPTAAPGYSTTCSGTYSDSKPHSSACWAKATHFAGSTPWWAVL